MRRYAEPASLAAIAALSIALHAATIPGQSLFVDEISEQLHARGPLLDVAMRADSMPPLYSLAVRAWVEAFGEGRGVRWLSVLFSLATMLVVWRTASSLAGRVAGVAAAAVYAALPMQLFYAQLIRGYALYSLAAAIGIHTAVHAFRSNRPADWARFAAAGVFGMWCHYYFAILLLLLLGALLLRRGPLVGKRPMLVAAAIVVGCLPLAPFLKIDFGYQKDLRASRPLTPAAAAYTGFAFFSGYTLGPTKNELRSLSGREAARAAAPWVAAVAAGAAPLAILGLLRLRRSDWLAPTLLLVFGPTLVVGLLGAAAGITFNPRFVAWCVVPIAIGLGAGAAEGLGRGLVARGVAVACAALLGVVATAAVYNHHVVDRYRFEDLAAAVDWLADKAAVGEPIFVVTDYMAEPLRFHAGLAGVELPPVVELPLAGQSDAVVNDAALADEAIATIRANAPRGGFWLVECREFHGDPDGLLRTTLQTAYDMQPQASFAGVRVERGSLDARPAE